MPAVQRNQMILRLKEELNAALAVVSHARESLTNEMNGEWAQKKLSVDDKFLRKLKEMTASFNSLTESKIRLDKAERAMEADMTPEEEREVVKQYLAAMAPIDLRTLVAEIRRERGAEHGDDYSIPSAD